MIYADNAATTNISDRAFNEMLPFLQDQYGNASSQYSLGRKSKRAIEIARKQIATAINAQAREIVFTSGGSEANSWVLRCIADAFKGENVHFITSSIEHHSILNTCHALEKIGVEITFLPVDSTGRISISELKEAIQPSTKLISIMLANNEIGTIQPIAEIKFFLENRNILLHTDAVQAVGHIPIDVSKLKVDFLTASAHKFNGAKGTGFLYMRSGTRIAPLISGGEQEHGLRAGTENVAGIVAAGYALEESVSSMDEANERLAKLSEHTIKSIQSKYPLVQVNGGLEDKLSSIVNLGFPDATGESLLHLLDFKQIYVSTSSACNSGKDEPSHVLIALGLTPVAAMSSIRISYGRYNTLDDAENIVVALSDIYNKILNSV